MHQKPDPQYRKGTIKFFNRGKGFGFIKPDSGGCDVFFTQASFKSFQEASVAMDGQRVQFRTQAMPKGPVATALEQIEPSKRPNGGRVLPDISSIFLSTPPVGAS